MGPFERMTMSDGAEIGVYRATPEGQRRGGLVLVQEVFCIAEHVRDMATEQPRDG